MRATRVQLLTYIAYLETLARYRWDNQGPSYSRSLWERTNARTFGKVKPWLINGNRAEILDRASKNIWNLAEMIRKELVEEGS